MILPVFLNSCSVFAYSGTLDLEDYVSLPSRIMLKNNVATCTISLVDEVNDYQLSYQKVDLSENAFNVLQEKTNSINAYITVANTDLESKKTDAATLAEAYKVLVEFGTATKEELDEAIAKSEKATSDLQEFYNGVKLEVERLQNELIGLVPDYTSSWTETTNTTDNVQLDFSDYNGKVYFVLWAKITNGTNTYYDINVYTTEVTDISNNDNNNTDNEDNQNPGNIVSQDWANSKFELCKEGAAGAGIKIKNVTPKENMRYYLVISSNPEQPTAGINEGIRLTYNAEKQEFVTTNDGGIKCCRIKSRYIC